MGDGLNLRSLATALLVLSAGLGGYYWWALEADFTQSRAVAVNEAGHRASQLADATAAEFEALLHGADVTLRQFRDRYRDAGRQAAAEVADTARLSFPPGAIEFLAVLDARGELTYATAAGAASHLRGADLQLTSASMTDKLVLHRPLRVPGTQDRWLLLLTRPLARADRFAGLAVLAMPIDYLAKRLAQLELNPDDTINILFNDGAYLARSLDWRLVMGQVEPADRPFLAPQAPPRGLYRASSLADQRPRLFAWQKLDGYPLLLTVGLDEAMLRAPVEATIARGRHNSALATAVFGGLVLLLAWLLRRSGSQQERLRASEVLLRSTLNATYDGIVVTDDEDRVLDANPQFFQFWDLPPDVFSGGDARFDRAYTQLSDPEEFKRRRREQEGQDSKHWDTIQLRNGRVLEAYKRIFDLPGRRVRLWCFRDITERLRSEAELRELATTDMLTGLPNRRHFVARMEEEIERVRRTPDYRAAFVLLDIDHFKRINDVHGHVAGDQVLRDFAAVVRKSLRKVDLAGRLGGEEFGVVLPEADAQAAQSYAQRLRQAVRGTPFRAGGRDIAVTVSLGVATLAAADTNPDGVMLRADKALYRAKQAGRDRVEVASPADAPGA